MARMLSDFVDSYIEYTYNTEPPDSYHIWMAISLIASALQRKVVLCRGHERWLANQYIVLVGPPGKCRKGTAIGLGYEVIESLPSLSVAADAGSRQALLTRLLRAKKEYADMRGYMQTQSAMSIFSEEWSVFFSCQSSEVKQTIDWMTDWYDGGKGPHGIWRYETQARSVEEIYGVCVNMFGCTTPENIEALLPKSAIGGGLTSRIVFVVEFSRRKAVADHELTDKERQLFTYLQADLEAINMLAGTFTLDKEANAAYVEWYLEQGDKLIIPDVRMAGYCARRQSHLLKLCMALSASHSDSLVITIKDFVRAKVILEDAERRMHLAFGSLGQADHAGAFLRMQDQIRRFGTISRSAWLEMNYLQVNRALFDDVITTLYEAKQIAFERDMAGKDVIYRWLYPERRLVE